MINIAEMNGEGPDRIDPMAMLVSSSSVALLADVSRSTVSSWRNPTRKRGFRNRREVRAIGRCSRSCRSSSGWQETDTGMRVVSSDSSPGSFSVNSPSPSR